MIKEEADIIRQKIKDGDYNLKRFFMHMAVCHTVVIDGDRYQASSPDELALVNGSK
jgi:magnesium-transporting ATPase (P-type)